MKNSPMLRNALVSLLLILASAPAAMAHPGHGLETEMTPRELALSTATYVVETMISRGAIEPSWRGIEPSAAQLRERGGSTEWIVSFENAAVRDATHRTLFVMLTQTGEYIAANYTGD